MCGFVMCVKLNDMLEPSLYVKTRNLPVMEVVISCLRPDSRLTHEIPAEKGLCEDVEGAEILLSSALFI